MNRNSNTHRHRDEKGRLQPEPRRRNHGKHGPMLRALRYRLGWTVKQMAGELLLAPSTVSGMENGREISAASWGVYLTLSRRGGLDHFTAVLEAA